MVMETGGEGSGVSNHGEGFTEPRMGDTWSPRGGNPTKFQTADIIVDGSHTGQNSGVNKGPNNGMGLSLANKHFLQYTPYEIAGNKGLNSQNNKALTESGWLVYSRKTRGQKKFLVGHRAPIPMTEITGPNLMTQCTQEGVQQRELQCTQEGVQQRELDFVELTHANDVIQNNGEGGDNPEPNNQQHQEALNLFPKQFQSSKIWLHEFNFKFK